MILRHLLKWSQMPGMDGFEADARVPPGAGAGSSACTRRGARARRRGRIAPCSVGSTRSRAAAIAPISSAARSACASTCWPCWRTSPRSRAPSRRPSGSPSRADRRCDGTRSARSRARATGWRRSAGSTARPTPVSGDGCVPRRREAGRSKSPQTSGRQATTGGRAARLARGWARRARAPRAARSEDRRRIARASRGRPGPRPSQGGAPDAQAATLPVPAGSRRAVPLARAAPPRRRHGPRQDRAGHRRLPRALALGPRSPGLLVVPAALKPQWLREWQLFTDAPATVIDGNPGQRRAAFAACRRGVPRGQLRTAPPRPGRRPRLEPGPRRARRGPANQELGDQDRPDGEAARSALPPGPDRDADGEPDRRAGVDRRVGGRPRAGAEVAPGAWHTTPVDGKTEIGGARNLDTLRSRLAGCMIRRVRKEVLTQLPARTDTRIPIEMTPEQIEEHDALNMPIAQLLARSKRRPLTQAEFLRLMMLLTTQRIIANGLAQLRFEEIWPDLSRIERPTESTLKGLSCPKLLELRELIGQIVLDQERKVVVFSQWRRMLRLARLGHARRARAGQCPGGVLHRRGGPEAPDAEHRGVPRRPRVPRPLRHGCRAAWASTCSARRAPASTSSSRGTRRSSSSGSAASTAWARTARSTCTTWSASRVSSRGSRTSWGRSRPSSWGSSTGRPTRWRSSGRAASSRGSSGSWRRPWSAPRSAGWRPPSRKTAPPSARSTPSWPRATRSRDARVPAAPEPASLPSAGDVQELFSGLTVQRTAQGGLVIEAPPETASTLAALFAGMAQLLQAAAAAPAPSRSPE